MRGIDESYIEKAIDELVDLLGVKEDIPRFTILKHFAKNNIKGCIEDIARYLGLPIVINLSYVSANYQARNVGHRFKTNAVTKTDNTKKGVAGIIAQVDIPGYLPPYGSSALENFPINVKISDNCINHPEAFVTIMAHELSHILLRSLMFKEKDNEYYTDLTPMILGFSNLMLGGRKVNQKKYGPYEVETLTSTYGYLSDELFFFAFNRIQDILLKHTESKEKLVRTLNACTLKIHDYKVELNRLNKYLEYLDKKQNKKIISEDGLKIVSFHSMGYVERIRGKLTNYERRIQNTREFINGFVHYTKQSVASLRKQSEETNILYSDVIRDRDLLIDDVDILGKYIGFFQKYKINHQVRH